MKVQFTYVVEYDTEEPSFKQEYLEQLQDHPDTLEAVLWFATDRFMDVEHFAKLDGLGATARVKVMTDTGTLIYSSPVKTDYSEVRADSE